VWIRILTSDRGVSTPRLACLSSLRCIRLSKGEIATFICPWHSPLKSVMLYQPQINWKPESSGERSTEAKPITLSSSVGEEKSWAAYLGVSCHWGLRLHRAADSGNWASSVIPKPSQKTDNQTETVCNHSLLWIPFLYDRERLVGLIFACDSRLLENIPDLKHLFFYLSYHASVVFLRMMGLQIMKNFYFPIYICLYFSNLLRHTYVLHLIKKSWKKLTQERQIIPWKTSTGCCICRPLWLQNALPFISLISCLG
jgi:hypothetical protein